MKSLSSGACAKKSSDSCDLRDITERDRVAGSWSHLECGIARSGRRATFKEPRAAMQTSGASLSPDSAFFIFQRFSAHLIDQKSTGNAQLGHPQYQ